MLSHGHLCASPFYFGSITSSTENVLGLVGAFEDVDIARLCLQKLRRADCIVTTSDAEMGDVHAVEHYPVGLGIGSEDGTVRARRSPPSSRSSLSARSSHSANSSISSSSSALVSSAPATDSSGNADAKRRHQHHESQQTKSHRWLKAESFDFDPLEIAFRPGRLPALLPIASESRRLRSLTHASWALDSHRVIYPTKPMLASDLEHRSLSKLDLLGAAALRFHAARRLHTRWPHIGVQDINGLLDVLLSDAVLGRLGKHYDLHVHARIGVSQLRQAPIRQTQRFAAQLFRAHVGALAEQAYERGGVRRLDAWINDVFDDAVFPDLECLARRSDRPEIISAAQKRAAHVRRDIPTRKRTRSASPPLLDIDLCGDCEPRAKRSRSESLPAPSH